jgi:anti-anti-sigma regulatory factor
MRRHTAVDDLRHLDDHDHVAWWGRGPEDLDQIALDAFAAGARRHERMMFVTAEPRTSRLAQSPETASMIDAGDLELASLADVYPGGAGFDAATQLTVFEQALDDALAQGYSGIRVVADNTPLVQGSDTAFASWLEWEYLADQLQATRPVIGVCYFDADKVRPDRMADLAAAHPVLPSSFAEPAFQLFCDDGVLRVVGCLEALFAHQLRRAVNRLPADRPATIDLSGAEFVDHRALLVLNDAATSQRPIVLRGTGAVVRKLWDLLDLPESHLSFEPQCRNR